MEREREQLKRKIIQLSEPRGRLDISAARECQTTFSQSSSGEPLTCTATVALPDIVESTVSLILKGNN